MWVCTFNNFLVYWQQDAVLKDELVTNLTFAGLGVFFVCMIALAQVPAALIYIAARHRRHIPLRLVELMRHPLNAMVRG